MTRSSIDGGRIERLAATLRSDLPPGRKLRQASWILGAIITPAPIKTLILPLFRRPPVSEPIVSKASPYIVRERRSKRSGRARVVHAIGNFQTGGSSQLVVDLIENLGDEFEQEVVTGFLPSPEAYVGVRIREFRADGSSKALLEYLRSFDPKLLHVHYWEDRWYRQVFEAGRRFGAKIVENVNTPVHPVIGDWVDQYVFVSEYVRRNFALALQRSRVIHPGSNLKVFSRPLAEVPVENCVGMVYRLERDKLDEQAIDVFIDVVRRRPQTRVLIVGGGSLLEGFQRAVSDARLDSAFEFTGYVAYRDLPALYRRLSIFVAPVWKESFGQVTSFAMGMALPVVGYDVGAVADVVRDPELLASPGDSAALAAIIVRLLDDRQRRVDLGRLNRERAHGEFSVKAMVAEYRALYRDLLSTST